MRRTRVTRYFAAILAAAVVPSAAQSASLISAGEALTAEYPNATFERETVFLTEGQMDQVENETGQRPRSALVTRFRARSGEVSVGWAYLDTHRVRTLPESVLVIVDLDGLVRRIEVVAFREPLDYLPPRSWYEQYEGRSLDDALELKRGIRPITGATLTARATTDAVRRLLSIHGLISAQGDSGESF